MTTTEKPMPQSHLPHSKGILLLIPALLAVFLLLEGDHIMPAVPPRA